MKEHILTYLACPEKINRIKTCHNELVLDEIFSFSKSNKKEIKEGYLKCKICNSRFPIFFGIPILISNLPEYLRNNFYIILELSKKYGQIDRKLIADSLLLVKKAKPKEKKELFDKTKKQYTKIVENIFENNYIINHYDNLSDFTESNEPLYDFIRKYQTKNPHLVLQQFLKLYSNPKDFLALEVGCNVGGFLTYLSQNSKFVFGLDNSFEHLFFASCLLKHIPKRINHYKVIIEANIKKRRFLNVGMLKNLTLIAGQGDNLPFKNSTLSIVSSCNLVDIIDNPIGLLREKIRVLGKNGLLLSSDPYEFLGENEKKLKIKKKQTSWQRMQEILKPRIKILEEHNNTPWISRHYQRNYTIYYNHSFCGRKIG